MLAVCGFLLYAVPRASYAIQIAWVVVSYNLFFSLAEALDNIEKTQGFRPDGFSASFYSIIHTVMMGLGQTILLAGINLFGYIVPQSTAQIIAQPEAVTSFFRWCFAGLPTVLYGICAVIMLFYKPNRTADR